MLLQGPTFACDKTITFAAPPRRTAGEACAEPTPCMRRRSAARAVSGAPALSSPYWTAARYRSVVYCVVIGQRIGDTLEPGRTFASQGQRSAEKSKIIRIICSTMSNTEHYRAYVGFPRRLEKMLASTLLNFHGGRHAGGKMTHTSRRIVICPIKLPTFFLLRR